MPVKNQYCREQMTINSVSTEKCIILYSCVCTMHSSRYSAKKKKLKIFFKKIKKLKTNLILSGLQVFRGLMHLFPACTGKWCLKCQANQRCHFVQNYVPQVMLLFHSMCNYSICAVKKACSQ